MRIFKVVCIFIACIIHTHCTEAAPKNRRRETPCDKEDTFFQHRHEYTYLYTVSGSSSFVGATDSRAGFRLTCTATFMVPKKCKYVLQLSACQLQERQEGAEGVYQKVEDAVDFLQDLQRYDVYFQMNKGVLVEGSIHADSDETLQALNFKRGLLSSLQFPIFNIDDYEQPITQKDVFGECQTKYSFTPNKGHSYRNLRECNLGQIFKKQFNGFGSTIRPQTGGYMEGPISEGIYPFVSEISCEHSMNSDKQLGEVSCLQQQYFKPAAYKGDILASAMTNVSQSLVLQSADKRKIKGLKVKNLSVIDIKFDFGDAEQVVATTADIEAILDQLAIKHGDNMLSEVPGLVGEMLQLLRSTSADVLEEVRVGVFSCLADDCDDAQTYKQAYLLDGLESCGSEACLLVALEAMSHGHMTSHREVSFYQGLNSLEKVTQDVIEKLWMYCDSSEKTSCWLSLGSVLSRTPDDDITNNEIVTSVLDHIVDVLEDNCGEEILADTARELNTAIKTLENMGFSVVKEYAKLGDLQQKLLTCLTNKAVPKSVRRSLLHLRTTFLETQVATGGKAPAPFTEALFSFLQDDTEDSVLKARSFSLLMKTTDVKVMERLVGVLRSEQKKQMKAYMASALKTLFENDQPDFREVKHAWQEYRKKNYFSMHYYGSDAYTHKFSKVLNFADFYKLPLTEYFGEQVYVDIVFDSASSVLSALQISVNFFYGDKKTNLFDLDLNIHGFDALFQMLSEDTGMTFQDLYAMYKAAKSGVGTNQPQFAKFQKDIVDAVIKIIQNANHPKFTDFDLELDLKFQGKNVLFVSLQELMGYLRHMQQQLGARSARSAPSMSYDRLLNMLLDYLEVDSFKSTEFASVVKVLPTCAGLPLNMTVWFTGLNVIQNTFNILPLQDFSNVQADINTHVMFENEMSGQLIVPVGMGYKSGMQMKIFVGSERHAKASFTYSRGSDGHLLMQSTLYPIPPGRESERLLHAQGRMFLLHQSGIEEVQPDPTLQTDYTRCANPKFQMLLGRSLCARVQVPDVRNSTRHAYFPLSGPFDVDVTFAKVDNVEGYTWAIEMFKGHPDYEDDTYFFNIVHNAPGDVMSRHIYFNATANKRHRIFNISAAIPEVQLEYAAVVMDTKIGKVKMFTLEEYIWIEKQPWMGYSLKGVRDDSPGVDNLVITTNLTRFGLSWELQWTANETELQDGETELLYHLTWSWYCSQEYPLLYLIHLSPTYAAQNGDVTRLGFKYIYTETVATDDNTIHLEFYDSILKVTYGKDLTSDGRNIRLAYETGGEEMVIIGEGTLTDLSSRQGMHYDLNLDVNRGDYNMILTGNVQGHPADITLTADLAYSKTEEDSNTVGRRKRSITGLYQHFMKLEEEIAENLKAMTNGLLGKDPATDTAVDPSNPISPHPGAGGAAGGMGGGMGQLPNMIPMFPSIWDMPSWNTQITLHSQLQPKFHGPPSPGAQPDGMEVVLTMDVTHPWLGGYRDVHDVLTVGKSGRTDFRYFWFWLDHELTFTYTALDGTPISDDTGEPYTEIRGGDLNVFRESGDRFEFSVHQFGPGTNMTYEILFDWDAYSHQEPLYHVLSHRENTFMPLLNHDYEEYLTVEEGHAIHAANFVSPMLNVSIQSDFYSKPKHNMDQDISVSLMVFGYGGNFTMKNTATEKTNRVLEFNSEVTVGSMPDKSLSYTIGMKDPRTIFIQGGVIPAVEVPTVILWTIDIALIETSIQQITFTWYPPFDERAKAMLINSPIQNALALRSFTEGISHNIGKPFKDQSLWFVGVTPNRLIRRYVMPKMIEAMASMTQVVANFVPLKTRQAILDGPGPKVPPRFAKLLAVMAAANADPPEPSQTLFVMQTMQYYTLMGASYGYLAFASRLPQSPALHQALAKREISFGWTNLFVVDRYFDFPETPEAIKHIFQGGRDVFGFYSTYYYYSKLKETPEPTEQLAVIYGRHAQDRPLSVQTFDQTFYEIPAEYAAACSYLLAADLMNAQWALVLTPQGLTLFTPQEAVTVTYDNYVYIGDSKQPSTGSTIVLDSQTGTVSRSDESITVEMGMIGVSLVCYTGSDVCMVAVKGSNRNRTLGLLGTSDTDKFTDLRLLSGHYADGVPSFLKEYAVGGADKCLAKFNPAQEPAVCNEGFQTACRDQFYKQYNNLYQCSKRFQPSEFKNACDREATRCDSDDEDMCYIYRAYTGLCERAGLVESPLEIAEVCSDTVPSQPQGMRQAGTQHSLDVVFVVSDHSSMLDSGSQPWKYMKELVEDDTWERFSDIRVGVVKFANVANIIEKQDFVEVDDFDWSVVSDMKGEGQTESDGFLALQKASNFPYRSFARKMVILLATKEQGTGKASNPKELLSAFTDKGIVVNVVSTYAKVSSRRVVGINWEEKVISRKSGYGENKDLPQNDYTMLVQGTKGALWDLDVLKGGRKKKVSRMVKEFIIQTIGE